METERRTALLDALRDLGEMEFLTESLKQPGRGLFEGHRTICDAFLEMWREEIPTPPGCEPITFHFLSRPELNACAFTKRNFRFVGMNWGSIIILHDLFFRMMACPGVLARVGNASVEIAPSKHAELPTDASRLPCEPGLAFGLTVHPRDPARGAYAMHLARIALDFLLLHEIQHAAGGHLSFREGANTSIITEVVKEPWIGDFLTAHVLEFEADAAAANITLSLALGRREPMWQVPAGAAPYLKTERDRCAAWLFAVLTLFLLIEEATNRISHHNSHPSPFLMRGFLTLSVFSVCGIFREGPKPAFDFAARVFRDIDIAIDAIAHRPRGKRFEMAGIGDERIAHMELVFKRWFEMQSRLDKLAKKNGALAAPAELVGFFCFG